MLKTKKHLFTIFTPTYNRGHLLTQIYKSLKSQSLQDFEWIIIDDGSTDNTKLEVEFLINRKKFPIKYKYQENSGKHVCYDVALKMANSEFFLPLDSDDIPKLNALENLYDAYDKIPDEDKSTFSAVTGLCELENGTIIGDKFPQNIFDSTPLDLLFKYKVKGDKWGFQKTDIRKQYSFDFYRNTENINDIKFYPEITIFGEIGRKYKTRYINESLKIVEYRKDGISKSKLTNALPKKISALYKLNSCFDYFRQAPREFIIISILYTRWSLHSHTFNLAEISSIRAMIMVILLTPFGFLLYLIETITSKISE